MLKAGKDGARWEDKFGEILVPVERVMELGKGGQRKISSRKFFPGYIFVNMELNDETWHIIRNTPKITGFVGHSTAPARGAGVGGQGDHRADAGRGAQAQAQGLVRGR